MLDDHWLVNLDVKKQFLNTDVSLNGGAIKADVDIDPWIVGIGIATASDQAPPPKPFSKALRE